MWEGQDLKKKIRKTEQVMISQMYNIGHQQQNFMAKQKEKMTPSILAKVNA